MKNCEKKENYECGTLEIAQLNEVDGGGNMKEKMTSCIRCGARISFETYRKQRGFCNRCYGK